MIYVKLTFLTRIPLHLCIGIYGLIIPQYLTTQTHLNTTIYTVLTIPLVHDEVKVFVNDLGGFYHGYFHLYIDKGVIKLVLAQNIFDA